MSKFALLLMLVVIMFKSYGQTFSRFEYFFDTDPGFGNGVTLQYPVGNNLDFQASINTNNLSAGLHWLYIRAKVGNATTPDVTNRWSVVAVKPIVVFPSTANSNLGTGITKLEYFYDNDFGLDNGIELPLNGGSDISQTLNFTTQSLSAGLHFLGVRTQTHQGQWSNTVYKPIYIAKSDVFGSTQLLTYAEYFIDIDQGFNNNIQVPLLGAALQNRFELPVNIPSNMALGLHSLGIRVKSERGQWSHTLTQTFVVLPLPVSEVYVNRIEYFVDDNDPGLGMATSISFTPNLGRNVTANLNFNLTGLALGVHYLKFRMMDTNEKWTVINQVPFEIVNVPCPNNLNISNSNMILAGLAQATQGIIASNSILSNQRVEYRAGNSIQMNPGFEVKSGSIFKVLIGGCL